jgi:hypothetical protein
MSWRWVIGAGLGVVIAVTVVTVVAVVLIVNSN